MRREHHHRTARDVRVLVHEHRTALFQGPHHVQVVHDLFADVDGGAVALKRHLDRLHGPVDTSAVTARLGEEDTPGGRRHVTHVRRGQPGRARPYARAGARRGGGGDQALTSGDFGAFATASERRQDTGKDNASMKSATESLAMASCTCPSPLRERFEMRFPQVSERVKEAPANALRAVFASIGQVRLVTDRMKNKPTELRSRPSAPGPVSSRRDTAPRARRRDHTRRGGHTRRGNHTRHRDHTGGRDHPRSGDRARRSGGHRYEASRRRARPPAEAPDAAEAAAARRNAATGAATDEGSRDGRRRRRLDSPDGPGQGTRGHGASGRGAGRSQARHRARFANGECPAAARLGRGARGRGGRTGSPCTHGRHTG